MVFAQQLELVEPAAEVAESPVPKLAFLVLLVVGAGCTWIWWVFLGRKRLIQDLPTSVTKGVALGLNELVGTAESSTAEFSPQASVECVWWKNEFYVEDGDNGWRKTRERQGGPIAFELTDDTGTIAVRPRKAEVAAPKVYEGPYIDDALGSDPSLVTRYLAGQSKKKRKVVERVIKTGDPVYVLGTAQLPMESLDLYIGPDRVGSEPFLLRVGSEDDALYRERLATAVGWTGAVLTTAGAGVAWADGAEIERGGFDWASTNLATPLLAVAILAAVMAVLSLVFVYNGLIRLRQRSLSAWAMIDVQLRRRHDLIPGLVEVVKAHAHHEAAVQTAVAQLRSSLASDLPANPSDAAVRAADAQIRTETVALDRLLALVENYPVLTADASYTTLRTELVDTEDRVALARAFYNNSVQTLHDRAHVFPGVAVAWIFELDLKAEFLGDLGGAAVPQVEPTSSQPAKVRSWTGRPDRSHA